jgi:hypothetical protein
VGKIYDELNDELVSFIEAQKLFFVGTAPAASNGHINISPKGMDSFRVLGATAVAYLDVTGSGVETLSHVKENGRLVIMFCAFDGKPLILRLHGQAEVLERRHPEFAALLDLFPELPGTRSIVRLNVTRIADSCGWNVPVYEYSGTRDYYQNYAEHLGEDGMREAQLAANMAGIDGLPGLSEPSV